MAQFQSGANQKIILRINRIKMCTKNITKKRRKLFNKNVRCKNGAVIIYANIRANYVYIRFFALKSEPRLCPFVLKMELNQLN